MASVKHKAIQTPLRCLCVSKDGKDLKLKSEAVPSGRMKTDIHDLENTVMGA